MKVIRLFYVFAFLIIIKIVSKHLSKANDETINKQKKNKNFLKSQKFIMTINEMDKMMFCSILAQKALRKDKDRIQTLVNISNILFNITLEKIEIGIMEKCLNKINMKIVNTYFKNLTYLGNYKWEKEFEEYILIDNDKYNNKNNYEMVYNQQLIVNKFEFVKEKFKLKQEEDNNKKNNEQNKSKIGNLDLGNIISNFRGVIFIIVYLFIFGCSLLILKTLVNEPKIQKDKKNNIK